MKIFVNIATLFVLGSLVGYLIEVIYRRLAHHKWVNPGFLLGPYIPIYGFANILLYGLNTLINNNITIDWVKYLIIILCNFVLLTLLELITGLIFIKGFHIKLWDYLDRFLNYKGIICPLFSLIWGISGSIYSFFVFPYLMKGLEYIDENLIYTFFIGLIIGMMLVDAAYSFHFGIKLKKASGELTIKLDQFKNDILQKHKDKKIFNSIISKYNKEELHNMLVSYGEKFTLKFNKHKKKEEKND